MTAPDPTPRVDTAAIRAVHADIPPHVHGPIDTGQVLALCDEVDRLRAVVEAVEALTSDVGNTSTGPTFVGCAEVRTAIASVTGGAR